MNNILEKILKIWYFENTHRDKSNDILYDNIYLCILVEKYGQSKLDQNYTFLSGSSIAGGSIFYWNVVISRIALTIFYGPRANDRFENFAFRI